MKCSLAKQQVNKFLQSILLIIFILLINIKLALAVEYSASFKQADLSEFINVVGKNLNKTIILDPSLRGTINVRSYNVLNQKQYYQFFLSVLQVYGFAVVDAGSGIIKVVKARDAKGAAIPVFNGNKYNGDEMITRIIPVYNVSVRELSPLLRQLNDTSGGGSVVHYDPSNIIMLTGRASIVNHLAEIIHRVDKSGDQKVDMIPLKYASSLEIVKIVNTIENKGGRNVNAAPNLLKPRIVADERTNSVIVSGEPKIRRRIVDLIHSLDRKLQTSGNTRVFYLRYAKAKEVVKVLKDMSSGKKQKSSTVKTKESLVGSTIEYHEGTNSVIVTASPALMASFASVIHQLDIRRAQVLVEAIIVEISNSHGINLSVQWGSRGGGTTFNGNGASSAEVAGAAYQLDKDPDNTAAAASVIGKLAGGVVGYFDGNWGVMLQALSQSADNNILGTPSITTLDNQEASFIVGQDIPILTGSAASSGNNNPFQTIERKQVGTKLTVTPQINEGDAIQLKINQEVSSIDGSTPLDVIFSERAVKTTVLAKSGQTIVIGGLIDDKVTETVDKVPLLGDIPYLGVLFRSTKSSTQKRNLMIFIRATIVRDDQTMQELSMRKYGLIRSIQRFHAKRGINMMPNTATPILPKWGESHEVVPEKFLSPKNFKNKEHVPDTSKAVPEDTSKAGPEDTSKAGPEDTSKAAPENTGKAAPEDTSKAAPQDTSKAGPSRYNKTDKATDKGAK
ncbi:MAG: type II secretion system secretin GspD [Psychromonas sp.]|nr:type II secretion system secretin GspD [Psychromonas sp.]